MIEDEPKRLLPKRGVLKKLFAYSGNRCALPTCSNPIFDEVGTLIGKVAHIHAAEKGGLRFDHSMSNEQRRAFENLMLVCSVCHDKIDDKVRLSEFPADVLRQHKKAHEDRLRNAERALLNRYVDHTQVNKPLFPATLSRLADSLDIEELKDSAGEVKSIGEFVGKVANLPIEQRLFALAIAERMRTLRKSDLLADDVTSAFGMSSKELIRQMTVIQSHGLGDLEDKWGDRAYVVSLYKRRNADNPWIELLDFCDSTGEDPEEILSTMDFTVYD